MRSRTKRPERENRGNDAHFMHTKNVHQPAEPKPIRGDERIVGDWKYSGENGARAVSRG